MFFADAVQLHCQVQRGCFLKNNVVSRLEELVGRPYMNDTLRSNYLPSYRQFFLVSPTSPTFALFYPYHYNMDQNYAPGHGNADPLFCLHGSCAFVCNDERHLQAHFETHNASPTSPDMEVSYSPPPLTPAIPIPTDL